MEALRSYVKDSTITLTVLELPASNHQIVFSASQLVNLLVGTKKLLIDKQKLDFDPKETESRRPHLYD